MTGSRQRVVILGAGFGGLEVASMLSQALGDEAETTLVDRAESFVFGFSKLDFMFGHTEAEHVRLPYADAAHPGVRMVRAEVLGIDPVARTVTLSSGELAADILVIALGADLDPAATPGLVEAGHEFYTVPGAEAARDALQAFDGGRVVVAVTSTPFKCPPAPSETALLLHDFLTERGLRDKSTIDLVMPLPKPVPPSPAASEVILAAFEERGIGWHPGQLVRSVDPAARTVALGDGGEMAFDLLLAAPKHHAPQVVVDAGLTEDGWIPVDRRTLRTRFDGVFAVGDVTSVGTPKAGVFSEGQAAVVAEQIIEQVRGGSSAAEYGGQGVCLMEFGGGQVAKVDVTFAPDRAPYGGMVGPSVENAQEKQSFGAERARRWFGRDWVPVPARK
ncbi:NAD(P)/FAD-dependent oxidoreductase [Ruania zhangjianzhongii]|uniref:NAD(P)/FAD-dependent oxidoreductase n=1 Tax=Ruania zhangjianzhongii TaxID=2603206 RepID=UPI0011CA582A|nr:FAD/NAD(P)-binding oxidoreductase [Ruania zhangjianzhongii]